MATYQEIVDYAEAAGISFDEATRILGGAGGATGGGGAQPSAPASGAGWTVDGDIRYRDVAGRHIVQQLKYGTWSDLSNTESKTAAGQDYGTLKTRNGVDYQVVNDANGRFQGYLAPGSTTLITTLPAEVSTGAAGPKEPMGLPTEQELIDAGAAKLGPGLYRLDIGGGQAVIYERDATFPSRFSAGAPTASGAGGLLKYTNGPNDTLVDPSTGNPVAQYVKGVNGLVTLKTYPGFNPAMVAGINAASRGGTQGGASGASAAPGGGSYSSGGGQLPYRGEGLVPTDATVASGLGPLRDPRAGMIISAGGGISNPGGSPLPTTLDAYGHVQGMSEAERYPELTMYKNVNGKDVAVNQGSGAVAGTFNRAVQGGKSLLEQGLNAEGLAGLLSAGNMGGSDFMQNLRLRDPRSQYSQAYEKSQAAITALQKAVASAGLQARSHASVGDATTAAMWEERQRNAQRDLDALMGSGASSVYNLQAPTYTKGFGTAGYYHAAEGPDPAAQAKAEIEKQMRDIGWTGSYDDYIQHLDAQRKKQQQHQENIHNQPVVRPPAEPAKPPAPPRDPMVPGYAEGGTRMINEPMTAVDRGGRPRFTFGEQAPARPEQISIQPVRSQTMTTDSESRMGWMNGSEGHPNFAFNEGVRPMPRLRDPMLRPGFVGSFGSANGLWGTPQGMANRFLNYERPWREPVPRPEDWTAPVWSPQSGIVQRRRLDMADHPTAETPWVRGPNEGSPLPPYDIMPMPGEGPYDTMPPMLREPRLMPSYAYGGSQMLNEPTMGVGMETGQPKFLAGEGGPEMASFAPMREPAMRRPGAIDPAVLRTMMQQIRLRTRLTLPAGLAA